MTAPNTPVQAAIGLGANMGQASTTLQTAARTIISNQGAFAGCELVAASHLYRSAPYEANGPDFLNAVLIIRTSQSAEQLLQALLQLEQQYGRERPARNAPRTLDLDLLTYGQVTIQRPGLTVPHPRLTQRRFVLEPLAEIAPGLSVPGLEGSIDKWLGQVSAQAVQRTELSLI
jgi:2-amino-4-hydroxy-6-hydroxymethyldihydropteridine diphosphokinase